MNNEPFAYRLNKDAFECYDAALACTLRKIMRKRAKGEMTEHLEKLEIEICKQLQLNQC